MRTRILHRWMPALLLPLLAAAGPANSSTPVRGEYLEARTASVFAGACHYNGERVTEGRSAICAWRIDGGSFEGVDLTGVRVAASVACDDNLAERGAARRTELAVDADTDARAAAAAVAWVTQRAGDQLGQVVNVRRVPITFDWNTDAFSVRVDGFAAMSVHAMPDHACCTQPELVWYQPLSHVTGRRVGYTELARVDTTTAGSSWRRSDENSAFYGKIADE